jgi:O-antigen/teichoic acid export membrane protein
MFDLGEKGGGEVGRYLTPFAYVCIAFALMIALFSEEVISLLTPKSYHGAINVVIILTMFYGSMFFGKQPQLIFAKKTHITSLLTLVGILLNVFLNIPFIMKWGALGAAWATLLAGLISGAISFLVSQHYYEIRWEYKQIAAILGIFYISSIVTILLREINVAYHTRIVFKLVSMALYAYAGVKIKLITTENLWLLKRSTR